MINYDGRRFREAGKPDGSTATYRQSGDLLWAEFSGGAVRRGSLCGRCAPDGQLEFGYTMVLSSGEVVCGRCRSTPSMLPDGRIHLVEQWERYGSGGSSGTSELEEVRE
jgi:hypothetical protein